MFDKLRNSFLKYVGLATQLSANFALNRELVEQLKSQNVQLSTNLNSAQEQLVVALDKLQIALGNDAADAETVAKAQNELFAVKAEIAKKSAEIELKDTEINNLKTANEVVVSQVDAINEELNQLESEINEESTKLETFIVPTLESTLSESEPATEIIAENTVIS